MFTCFHHLNVSMRGFLPFKRNQSPSVFNLNIQLVDQKNYGKFNELLKEVFSDRKACEFVATKVFKSAHWDSYQNFLLIMGEDSSSSKITHCQLTALIIEAVAHEVLFQDSSALVMDSGVSSLPEIQKEMQENALKLYQFRINRNLTCHFFTAIKFPSEDGSPLFFLYQSFFNQYSLNEYMETKEFKSYRFSEFNVFFLEPLSFIAKNIGSWDDEQYDVYRKMALMTDKSFSALKDFENGLSSCFKRSSIRCKSVSSL